MIPVPERCLSPASKGMDRVGRPLDPMLPQLDTVLNPRLMASALEYLLGEPTEVTEAVLIRYKPGRRCTCRYDVWVGAARSIRRARLYAKTYASERGATVFRVTRAIAAARACGPRVWLPEPVGYLPHLKLIVHKEVPGTPVVAALIAGDAQLVVRIADALHALHRSGLELGRRHDPNRELDPLTERVERLCAGCPSLARRARRCLRLVRHGGECIRRWRWHPVHRDFYHDQVLASGQALSILDFDDAAMSEPAVDVANFLAHLRLLSFQHAGKADALTGIATGFQARYRHLDRALDPALVRFLEGATLLRLAEIHLRGCRGEWLAACLLDESQRLLRSN